MISFIPQASAYLRRVLSDGEWSFLPKLDSMRATTGDDLSRRPFGQRHRIGDVLSLSGQDFKSTELKALILRFEEQINRVFARL